VVGNAIARSAPAVLSLLALAAAAACRPAERVARPNVLVISLDTTRADRLGIYGYERPTTPVLDRLAHDGAWFERAYTTATWTLPAHASLFTGKFPKSHGARYDADGPLVLGDQLHGPSDWKRIRARGLGADQHTLAERLRDAGYRTGGVVGGPWLEAVFGLSRGFEEWDDRGITTVNGRPAASVTNAALAWLDAPEAQGKPFFLFLNYFDPHTPLYPPANFVDQVVPAAERPKGEAKTDRDLSNLYDGEIRTMDFHIGRLLDALRAKGLYDSMLIVAVADHGELLGEHGERGHGASLYQPELRIPLIVKPPRGEDPRGRRDEVIQISDVFPMILQRVGLPVPADVQAAFPPPRDRMAFAEVNPLKGFGRRGDWRAAIDGDWKYLESAAGDRLLFDVARDPDEAKDESAAEPARAERMRAAVDGWIASLPEPAPAAPGTTEIDAETKRALESLGYLQGEKPPAPSAP
jgi:arylsulfatase A-like enzyme